MRVLIVGGGGREHAMARALRSAPDCQLLSAPGNPGTAELGRNVAVAAEDVAGLVELVRRAEIELVVPGPEGPLVRGLADALRDLPGVLCCGPTQAAAALEGSKVFTRTLAHTLGIPSPAHRTLSAPEEVSAALQQFTRPPVLKADGLCAGKGVFLPTSFAECEQRARALLGGALGEAGRQLVVEERLLGTEASLFFACHGEQCLALPHARDHKRLRDGDAGPNTGGMGAVSPNPTVDAALTAQVAAQFVQPVLRELQRRGTPFVGFLFVGLMLTAQGPRLLEFNVRLGDPEAQAILPRLAAGEFLRLCRATARGELADFRLAVDPRPTCAVVLAAAGYPDHPSPGAAVELDPALTTAQRCFIHAGTSFSGQALKVRGGRVGAIVAQADTAEAAREHAYAGLSHVRFAQMQYRTDIGAS
jgi:phosphoribosylamine--glycine ligase